MFITFMGTVVIAGIIGYVSEKTGWTKNGYLQSIIICIGGAILTGSNSRTGSDWGCSR